ncbi:Late secretory pathway protein AVL9 [Liparis tanakae]|uniref:Late secretory pathway protein AVL9 n=1 Tax=Liparis tanakae TaxID=230148 RepID=A0A4Z2F631_9TELE|nr:Late secretory pathway protein AVL9 [Liparis tanakae]
MESHGRDELKGPVLHIVVVGFHHKKGCQALKVRQADVTRETVQKSVCVLSRVELYDHMNGSLRGSALEGSQMYLGLSPRDLILHFRHKVLILFKLILLEKKVLFYVSPVNRLVGALMTVLSLFPGMIEHGLADSSHYRPQSGVAEDLPPLESVSGAEGFVSVSVTDFADGELEAELAASAGEPEGGDRGLLKPPPRGSPESSESEWETLDPGLLDEGPEEAAAEEDAETRPLLDGVDSAGTPITVQPQAAGGQGGVVQGLVSGLEEDRYGLPLPVFTKGYLCLPYMALQQHHLLSDVTVRGFVAGATNILFRQQRHLSDAVVEVEEAGVHVQDPELRRTLALTTADLRFADYLVKHVTENRDDVFLDGTGWEGGDEWIRAQFTLYLHSLLSSTLQLDNERLLADYGVPFVTAWKITHNYRVWFSNKHPAMAAITPGHPFQGQYSVADVKLRLSHSVQNSERGKKIGNAMMTTSRSVVQTGKAVGEEAR